MRRDLRNRLLRWSVVALTLAMAGGLCHVWIRLRALHLAYALAEETRRLDDVEETSRRLRAEVAFLKNPAQLEAVARERFSMAPADPRAVRRLPAARAEAAR